MILSFRGARESERTRNLEIPASTPRLRRQDFDAKTSTPRLRRQDFDAKVSTPRLRRQGFDAKASLADALRGAARFGWVPNLLLWVALVMGSLCGALAYHWVNLGAIWFAAALAFGLSAAVAIRVHS
jgi:hypothetical protein